MADFSILIQEWFRLNRRSLPWRETNNPYKVWISEIILQQTRVIQGTNYYLNFISAFPTVQTLANADENEVLKLWQGLGYYSRARNIHFSAKKIISEFNGVFPTKYKDVLSLKGVGSYTAAAISSISYGLPHAVVDGNVYRVLSRYLEIETPIDSIIGKKQFEQVAASFLDHSNPGNHNQALMELGALICHPKNPTCLNCPLNESCLSNKNGTQLNFPIKIKKIKTIKRYFNYMLITDGINTIIKKRTEKDIWLGLYDFPIIETKMKQELTAKDIAEFDFTSITKDGDFKHVLSHQIINASFWIVKVKTLITKNDQISIPINKVEDYPLPQLLIRYIKGSLLFARD